MGVLFSSCSRRKAFPLNKVYKGGRRQEIKFGFGLKPCRLTTQIYFMMCTADHRVGVCVAGMLARPHGPQITMLHSALGRPFFL
jgi:hypothetical protein